ncbi:MAG: hypothetical protein OIN88_04520 [Candidatus Methanoperedens sp.]|nr:hypothetical protein [Candidatus Methanoperedens sp.]
MITETEVRLVARIILLTLAASIAVMTVQSFFPGNPVLINRLAGGIIGVLTIMAIRKIGKDY